MDKINFTKEMLANDVVIGQLRLVTFKLDGNKEICFECMPNGGINPIYYDGNTEQDYFVGMDNFSAKALKVLKEIMTA